MAIVLSVKIARSSAKRARSFERNVVIEAMVEVGRWPWQVRIFFESDVKAKGYWQ